MTPKKSTTKKVKVFSWEYAKTKLHIIIPVVLGVVFVLWYVFKKIPDDERYQALIDQQKSEILQLDSANRNEADYREFMKNSLEGIKRQLNEKDHEKTKIYERIRIETKYLDSLTVPDMQKWFNTRTDEGNTQPEPVR